jgi:hypothetical protein
MPTVCWSLTSQTRSWNCITANILGRQFSLPQEHGDRSWQEKLCIRSSASNSDRDAEHGSVVAVYDSHAAEEAAVRKLAKSGFDMKTLSIIGKDYSTEEGVVGFYNAGDRMKAWGKTGAFWGGLRGMLFGSALFVIPGVGPLFAAGPLVAGIAGGCGCHRRHECAGSWTVQR